MSSTTTDRRLGLTGSAAIKVPCKAATTANITLSGAQTVDGVSVTTGDRVLVKSQTSSVNNGIYVADTGTWTRDLDFDGVADAVTGTIVMVLNGSANANTYWRLTTTGTVTFGTSAITFAAALAGDSAMVTFLPSGTTPLAGTVQGELRKLVRVSQQTGADFGAQLTNALAVMPAAGGIIDATDITGAQTVSSTITITKPVVIYMGAYTVALGTNQVLIQVSSAGFVGLPKADENNSRSRFTYSGTGEGVQFKSATTSTPIFGSVWRNMEVDALGSAVVSATAKGVAFYGTRYDTIENPECYNFTAGVGMYFTGNGSGAGFGGTHTIINPAMSTNATGILADTVGGSASTHGHIYGGYSFGSAFGFDTNCESWRIFGTDLAKVRIGAGSNDAVLMAPRFENVANTITVVAGAVRTQIIAPSFINTTGTDIADSGTNTVIVSPAKISIPGSAVFTGGVTPGHTAGVSFTLADARAMRSGTAGGTFFADVGTFGIRDGDATANASGKLNVSGGAFIASSIAIPAGGATATGAMFSTTAGFGVFFGSGAPTVSAAKGSLYLRSNGTTTNDRMYVNTDGGTTWTAVTTAA